MSTSAVPDAIDALRTVIAAAVPTVTVHDGPPNSYVDQDWIAVGHDPTGDGFSAVEGWTQEPRGLGQMGREERFDVVCSLASSSGDPEMEPRRAQAFTLLAAIETALRSNPGLTTTVRFAEFTTGTFLQSRGTTEAGRSYASASIGFRITCQARV